MSQHKIFIGDTAFPIQVIDEHETPEMVTIVQSIRTGEHNTATDAYNRLKDQIVPEIGETIEKGLNKP